jgi:hypothetical protein
VRRFSPPAGFDSQVVQPVASRYTDWAVIPGHHVEIFFMNNIEKDRYNVNSNNLRNKIWFLWNVKLCCWERSSRRFEGSWCLHLRGQPVQTEIIWICDISAVRTSNLEVRYSLLTRWLSSVWSWGRVWRLVSSPWRWRQNSPRNNSTWLHMLENLWWCIWLRHCATSLKVTGSITVGSLEFIYSLNPSGRIVALGTTRPLTEMSTRELPWGVKVAGVSGW